MPLVLSNDSGIRPAGDFDKCFYCNQKVGTPHKENCVCLQKKVKLRFSFDLEVEVPYSWDKEDINYYYNEGTWCANNAISLINEYLDKNNERCLCPITTVGILKILEMEIPYRTNDKEEIVK